MNAKTLHFSQGLLAWPKKRVILGTGAKILTDGFVKEAAFAREELVSNCLKLLQNHSSGQNIVHSVLNLVLCFVCVHLVFSPLTVKAEVGP
jgi:hypothetical protein